jgi:transcriptional regulator with XRE-family HTH domain
MKTPPSLATEAALVAEHAKTVGLTQQHIAEAVGASQSQVSRILSGGGLRRSKLFERVCKYVFSVTTDPPTAAPERSPALMAALGDVWDGTPGHAEALALVIRSLGALGGAASNVRSPARGRGRPK